MSMEWEKGVVCFARGRRWKFGYHVTPYDLFCCNNADLSLETLSSVIKFKDFQLNKIREGDYIESSELDTEQKYNDAIDVFALFGFECNQTMENLASRGFDKVFVSGVDGEVHYCDEMHSVAARKITYPQLMAIGKLKRAMIEREKTPLDVSGFNTVEQSREKRARRNKSKQAYEILKSLDYEYDLVKQQWYKKQYV